MEAGLSGQVIAGGMPGKAWMFGAQRGKACGGKAAALIGFLGVRFLDPAHPATSAELVVDAEHGLTGKVGCPLPPAHAAR
jgi:hypothetical protein